MLALVCKGPFCLIDCLGMLSLCLCLCVYGMHECIIFTLSQKPGHVNTKCVNMRSFLSGSYISIFILFLPVCVSLCVWLVVVDGCLLSDGPMACFLFSQGASLRGTIGGQQRASGSGGVSGLGSAGAAPREAEGGERRPAGQAGAAGAPKERGDAEPEDLTHSGTAGGSQHLPEGPRKGKYYCSCSL